MNSISVYARVLPFCFCALWLPLTATAGDSYSPAADPSNVVEDFCGTQTADLSKETSSDICAPVTCSATNREKALFVTLGRRLLMRPVFEAQKASLEAIAPQIYGDLDFTSNVRFASEENYHEALYFPPACADDPGIRTQFEEVQNNFRDRHVDLQKRDRDYLNSVVQFVVNSLYWHFLTTERNERWWSRVHSSTGSAMRAFQLGDSGGSPYEIRTAGFGSLSVIERLLAGVTGAPGAAHSAWVKGRAEDEPLIQQINFVESATLAITTPWVAGSRVAADAIVDQFKVSERPLYDRLAKLAREKKDAELRTELESLARSRMSGDIERIQTGPPRGVNVYEQLSDTAHASMIRSFYTQANNICQAGTSLAQSEIAVAPLLRSEAVANLGLTPEVICRVRNSAQSHTSLIDALFYADTAVTIGSVIGMGLAGGTAYGLGKSAVARGLLKVGMGRIAVQELRQIAKTIGVRAGVLASRAGLFGVGFDGYYYGKAAADLQMKQGLFYAQLATVPDLPPALRKIYSSDVQESKSKLTMAMAGLVLSLVATPADAITALQMDDALRTALGVADELPELQHAARVKRMSEASELESFPGVLNACPSF